jgi:hypothetical protein
MKKTVIRFASIALFLCAPFISVNSLQAQTNDEIVSSGTSFSDSNPGAIEQHSGVIIATNILGKYYQIQDSETQEIFTLNNENTNFELFDHVTYTLQRCKNGKVIIRNVTR